MFAASPLSTAEKKELISMQVLLSSVAGGCSAAEWFYFNDTV